MNKQTQYVVFFQDNSRKNFLDLSSLADNLEEMDALNCFEYFGNSDHYLQGDFFGIWEETNEAVRISLAG